MPSSVAFPALCIPKDGGVYAVSDLSELQQCRGSFRHFDGLRIFDWEERAHEVTRVSVSRPASGIGRFVSRLFDLGITVDLETSSIGTASVPHVVSAVQKAIEDDPELFEELSGHSIQWWKAVLAEASSVRDVIRCFGIKKNDG